jgi:lysozyme
MIEGIDISHLNDHIDIGKLPGKGFGFVWLKASQGLTYQDPAFQTYWKDCKEANMIHGCYHFFDPRFDGIQQAKNFLSRGVNFSLPRVLPPCVDVEDLVGKDEADTTKQNKWVADNWKLCLQRLHDFLGYVKDHTGKDCIIYTYNNYPKEYYPGAKFPNNGMWLSSLQSKCPVRYDTGKLPEFWQYTYRLNNTDLDGDYFMGTQEQLNELANIKPHLNN